MKNERMLAIVFALSFTACGKVGTVTDNLSASELLALSSTLTESAASVATNPAQANWSYVYALSNGVIKAYPIDEATGNLIQPQYGSWFVRPNQQQNFYTFVISPNGDALYGFDRDHNVVYQYSITDNAPYSEYGSNIPLTALTPSQVNVGVLRQLMTFGTDGKLYIQNYANTQNYMVDQYTMTNGKLSLTASLFTTGANNALTLYSLTFARKTNVTQGAHSYRISNNKIIHSVGGADLNQVTLSAAISDLGIH